MKKIFVPSHGIEDWKRGLAEPEKQWKAGYSAHALASSWEAAQGMPKEVRACFAESGYSRFATMELLAAFPEYQVDLPPVGGRPSQNDIFAIALDAQNDLLAIMIEGKKEETFGPTIAEWKMSDSSGKQTRLAFLCEQLGFQSTIDLSLRYQLLHRSASALIQAKRFKAKSAVMIVQSFSGERRWFDDYSAFVKAFGRTAGRGELTLLTTINGLDFYSGWVTTSL
jgi:hypothetical protein